MELYSICQSQILLLVHGIFTGLTASTDRFVYESRNEHISSSNHQSMCMKATDKIELPKIYIKQNKIYVNLIIKVQGYYENLSS